MPGKRCAAGTATPRADDPAAEVGLPLALVGLVVLQGLFGKWMFTLLLKPAIVTLHLLGGMALVALLAWLTARHLGIKWRSTLDAAPTPALG